MIERQCAVYILTNKTRTVLYTGVTNTLGRRLWEHRTRLDPECFTARYSVTRLVYCEAFDGIGDAICREKQIKGWVRRKKVALIEGANPEWKDLTKRVTGG